MGVTDDGQAEVAELIRNDGSGLRVSAINIGEDDTAFDSSQTSLLSEADFEGGLTTTRNANTMTIEATFENVPDSGGSVTILEAGMVSQDDPTDDGQASKVAADVQVSRQVVPQVNLLENDRLDVTFELDVQNVTN